MRSLLTLFIVMIADEAGLIPEFDLTNIGHLAIMVFTGVAAAQDMKELFRK